MKLLRATAALALTGTLVVIAPAAPAQAELGGFTMVAEAAPIAMHIYEALLPIPAEPQLELNLSYSRAKFSTGPSGRAVSSLLWPGDAVGFGLPELLKNPDMAYPIKVDAAHPSGPKDGKQELVPGTGMISHADEKSVEASSSIAKPALPALPTPGVPIPPGLIGVEAFSSNAKAIATADRATATAYATAGTITLLGGLVKIHGLRTETEATSDGTTATTKSMVTWGSMTVAGQTFAVDSDGIKSPLGVTAMPKLPDDVVRRLADFGMTITPPKVDRTVEGGTAKVMGRGLTFSLDTKVLRNKLSLGWLLDPFLKLLPADLRTQISPWLDLAPKFVFILGTSSADTAAMPAFKGDIPAPITGGGSDGGSGSGVGSGGDLPPAATEAPIAVAGRQWPIFPGVPFYLFLLGLALAAAVSWGLRQYAGMLFASAGCEMGAANGIPRLRER